MGPIRGRSAAGVAAGVLALLTFAAPASAASTYTVTSFVDGTGSCSGTVCTTLRAAVTAADANPGSTISLGAGTYQLSVGELATNVSASSGNALTIDGAGPGQTAIKQVDGHDRVLDLTGGGPYLVENLEVTGGHVIAAPGAIDWGGGINTNVSLTLDHVAIVGNSVTGGAGAAGSSSFAGGDAFGGGLEASGTVLMEDSTIADNTTTGGAGGSGGIGVAGTQGGVAWGGGIDISSNLLIEDSTIADNTAAGGTGGGSITATPAAGGNAHGGGIHFVGQLDLEDSTITGNTAADGAGGSNSFGTTAQSGSSDGGGISGPLGTDGLRLYSDTLDGNTGGEGGNLYAGPGTQALAVNNTVFAAGVAPDDLLGIAGNCLIDAPGVTLTDWGHNFETDPTPSGRSACDLSSASGDLFGSSAKLSALADNGGVTETMMPQAGSPLLRAGGTCIDLSIPAGAPLNSDQRGEPRGSVCDIGAVQVQAAAATGAPHLTGTPAVGQTLSCSASGVFTGDGLLLSYAWLRNGAPISGQTGTSYQLAAADAGTTVSCSVTATAIAGAPVTVKASDAIAALPTAAPTAAPAPGTIALFTRSAMPFRGSLRLVLSCTGGSKPCLGTVLVAAKIGTAGSCWRTAPTRSAPD